MIYNVARTIDILLDALVWLIIIRSLASIFIKDYGSPLVRVLYEITEPVLVPFRKLIEKLNLNTGMVDFSPFLAIIALNIASRFMWGIIF